MNLPMIEMPREAARDAFHSYRHAVRSAKTRQANSEDAQIARAYKALSEGKQVININDAFDQAGLDEMGYPHLAIARADEKIVGLWGLTNDRFYEIGATQLLGWRRHHNSAALGDRVFRFAIPEPWGNPPIAVQAIVPNIPPAFRPPFELKNYHLLWEAKWERIPRAPKDPALLKRLSGPLYAVLAVWDLTPVEQAVLGLTRRP